MGRAEKRAKGREEAKLVRTAGRLAAEPEPAPRAIGDEPHAETTNETARRIYRTGSEPERRRKGRRQAIAKPRKWREGHQ